MPNLISYSCFYLDCLYYLDCHLMYIMEMSLWKRVQLTLLDLYFQQDVFLSVLFNYISIWMNEAGLHEWISYVKLIGFIKNLKDFDKRIIFILRVIEGNDAGICYEKIIKRFAKHSCFQFFEMEKQFQYLIIFIIKEKHVTYRNIDFRPTIPLNNECQFRWFYLILFPLGHEDFISLYRSL